MNPQRYTYMHGKPTKPAQDAERSAFHTSQHSLSKPSLSKQAQGQKLSQMASRIVQQVNRLTNTTSLRVITKDMLKDGGSKIFFDVFAILAKGIDDRIERDHLSLDGVLSFLKIFGYPGFLGKNIFQPIGAPHTWLHCLAILDFVAQVSRYASSFKNYCQELAPRDLEKDENYLIMQAVQKEDSTALEDRYRNELVILKEKAEKVNQETHRCETIINNMNFQQRPLEEVRREIEFQMKKEAELDNDIGSIRVEKEFLKEKLSLGRKDLQRAESRQMELNKQQATLEYKLANNELTPEENQKLQEEKMIKKAENQMLEETLTKANQRIRAGCQSAVSQVRMAYDLTHFGAVQAAKHSEVPFQIPRKHNVKEFLQLAQSLLFSSEFKEGNVSQQIDRISAQWQLLEIKHQLQNIDDQIAGRVRERQRKNTELELKVKQLNSKYRSLIQFRDELRERSNKMGHSVEEQFEQLKKLRELKEEKMRKTQELKEENQKLKLERLKVEEEIMGLMAEIEGVRDQSNQFVEGMNHHLKVADQALEKAKEEMLVLLKKYGEDLKEVLARSKASALLEQMVDEIHLKEKEQIKEKQRESD